MNANELTDELKEISLIADNHTKIVLSIAETMLRQQQEEIERWKDQYQRLNESLEMWKSGHFKQQAEIETLKYEKSSGVYDDEPVAWMSNGKEFYVQKNYCPDFIPLYTHPAKTLTDEEMISIYEKDWSGIKCGLGRAVESAILKKANEK